MADEEQRGILNQGAEAWNRWRRANPAVEVDLSGIYLVGAYLKDVHMAKANLSDADLTGAYLVGSDFTEAYLRRAKLSAANINGAKARSACFRDAHLIGTELNEADLQRANFSYADLRTAKLVNANLSRACLIGADLSGDNLYNAEFSAGLDNSTIRGANLNQANLRDADLRGAKLVGASLSGAKMKGAQIGGTTLVELDLSDVEDLHNTNHFGASHISIDTIYLSKGNIPIEFVRGAGVPDNFIDYMRSLVIATWEYYSSFISYSTQDQEFASRLHADLQNNDVRCWFAPHDVQPGQKLHEQIDVAIRMHERLLLILSPNSINSEWVKTEIAKARRREVKEGKRVLFPIRLNISFEQLQDWECFDADSGKDSAREIREYYIPDFSGWKSPATYQEEFKKLLQGFKKAEGSSL